MFRASRYIIRRECNPALPFGILRMRTVSLDFTVSCKVSQRFEIFLPSPNIGIVMACPSYGIEIFWLRSSLIQRLPHGKRYDFILLTMNDELGNRNPSDFFNIIEM